MSTDIGVLAQHALSPKQESDEELAGTYRAEQLWRDSPDDALSGKGLLSSETRAGLGNPIMVLATEGPERFVELASYLSPVIQDILLQYYLLGRTYAQIGAVLFPGKTRLRQIEATKDGNRIGLKALAVVVKYGAVAHMADGAEGRAWRAMLDWKTGAERCRGTRMKAPADLGDFVIAPNGQLGELFARKWSVLGRASIGGM